ncbi:MAG TPA: hypothetical protein VGM37_11335 [Armatimonadota bacterium]
MKRTVLCSLVAGALLICGPGYARKASAPKSRLVHASFYNAPSRSSFASRHREWRGHTFAISYRGRTVHAVCRDYGPRAYTGREIDVSRDVAHRLGFVRSGTAHVHIQRVR